MYLLEKAKDGGWAGHDRPGREIHSEMLFAGDRQACLGYIDRQMVAAEGATPEEENFRVGLTA